METDTWSLEFELKVKSIFEQFFSSGDASVLDELTAMGLSDMQILDGVKAGCGVLVEEIGVLHELEKLKKCYSDPSN